MAIATTKKKAIELISEMFNDKGFNIEIIEHVNLIDDLGMDSITFISLVIEIEASFGIAIPDDMLLMESFNSVDNIASIVENELSKKL
jgi:acyl carrier protein